MNLKITIAPHLLRWSSVIGRCPTPSSLPPCIWGALAIFPRTIWGWVDGVCPYTGLVAEHAWEAPSNIMSDNVYCVFLCISLEGMRPSAARRNTQGIAVIIESPEPPSGMAKWPQDQRPVKNRRSQPQAFQWGARSRERVRVGEDGGSWKTLPTQRRRPLVGVFVFWRRLWDSNPGCGFTPHGALAMPWFKPLTQVSNRSVPAAAAASWARTQDGQAGVRVKD